MKPLPVVLLFMLLNFSCAKERKVHTSFYYWNTVFELSEADKNLLASTMSRTIYLRCFDVDWIPEMNGAFPVAPVSFVSSVPPDVAVIPVIYVTNKSLLNLNESEIPVLAKNIRNKLNDVLGKNVSVFNELQLDCDWTISTREKYFLLLNELKRLQPGLLLSATIRLHQVKYYKKTGIPPVDRGMLMYYNMGKLNELATENSIYDAKDAAGYLETVDDYPLKLDIALPAFSWAVHFKNGKINGLINNLTAVEIRKSGLFKEYDKTHFRAIAGTFFKGSYFRAGDQLRIEEINAETCMKAAEQIEPYLAGTEINLAFYQLKSVTENNYEIKDIEAISAVFN